MGFFQSITSGAKKIGKWVNEGGLSKIGKTVKNISKAIGSFVGSEEAQQGADILGKITGKDVSGVLGKVKDVSSKVEKGAGSVERFSGKFESPVTRPQMETQVIGRPSRGSSQTMVDMPVVPGGRRR